MPTIVEYTDRKSPYNAYPERIISPPHSQACCFTHMEEIGSLEEEGRLVFRYKRCRACGFSVREILRCSPDPALVEDLRELLKKAFRRNGPSAMNNW